MRPIKIAEEALARTSGKDEFNRINTLSRKKFANNTNFSGPNYYMVYVGF